MSKLIWVFLPAFVISPFYDRCKCLKGTGAMMNLNGYATAPYLKDMMADKSAMKLELKRTGIRQAALVKLTYEKKIYNALVLEASKTIESEYVRAQSNLNAGTRDTQILYCEFDKNSIWVAKKVLAIVQDCQNLEDDKYIEFEDDPIVYGVKNGRFAGSVRSMRGAMNTATDVGEVRFGPVKLLKTTDGSPDLTVTISARKAFPLAHLNMNLLLEEEEFGPRFRGCYYDKDWVFFINESFPDDAGSNKFLTAFRQKSRVNRLEFYLKMAQSVKIISNLEYVHNDIRPSNFKIDAQGNLHLAVFDTVGAAWTSQPYEFTGTIEYASMNRFRRTFQSSLDDIYSLAVSFLVMEATEGEKIFETDPATGQARAKEENPVDPAARKKFCEAAIEKYIKPNWRVDYYSQTFSRITPFENILRTILLADDRDVYIDDLIKYIQQNIKAYKSLEKLRMLV